MKVRKKIEFGNYLQICMYSRIPRKKMSMTLSSYFVIVVFIAASACPSVIVKDRNSVRAHELHRYTRNSLSGAPDIAKVTRIYESYVSACAPPCCKNLCCACRFCTDGGGSCGQQIQANVQGPLKKMLAQGAESEAPRRRWRPGQEQHLRQENQDSLHMLNQPRGSFLECVRGYTIKCL